MSAEPKDEATDELSTFYVRLIRPRFDLLAVAVKAADHKEAEAIALEQAKEADEDDWTLLDFEGLSYGPHVQRCTADYELEGASTSPEEFEEFVKEALAPEGDDEYRYLLLLADVSTGEGHAVWDQWFYHREPELLEGDLLGDWIDDLTRVKRQAPEFPEITREVADKMDAFIREVWKRDRKA